MIDTIRTIIRDHARLSNDVATLGEVATSIRLE